MSTGSLALRCNAIDLPTWPSDAAAPIMKAGVPAYAVWPSGSQTGFRRRERFWGAGDWLYSDITSVVSASGRVAACSKVRVSGIC